MTREDVMNILNRKITDVIEVSKQDHDSHNNEAWSSYYSGVVQGLKDAKSVVGMIDKPNNHTGKMVSIDKVCE